VKKKQNKSKTKAKLIVKRKHKLSETKAKLLVKPKQNAQNESKT
jgi:hypothetical protein